MKIIQFLPARDNFEYLGIKITRQGLMPLPDKVQAFYHIAVPTNEKQLRRFIGEINNYKGMCKHRSDILIPLSIMTSKQATWNWIEEHQKAFEHMKKSISRETLLVYPNFSKPFVIKTVARKVKLSQDNKPKALYRNPAKLNYTTTIKHFFIFMKLF